MIVPMKKVSLLLLDSEKENALKKLRRLGLMHIEITEGAGEKLAQLSTQISTLENGLALAKERLNKSTVQQQATAEEAQGIAATILALTEEKKVCQTAIAVQKTELDRLQAWGKIDPEELAALAEKGVAITLCEMPPAEYDKLTGTTTLTLSHSKALVRLAVIGNPVDDEAALINSRRVSLPSRSTAAIQQEIAANEQRLQAIDTELDGYAAYTDSLKAALTALQKAAEFETYASGMAGEVLSADEKKPVTVAYFTGYIPASDLEKLQSVAKENAWGLVAADPTTEDDVPTKLHNNKLVSLIYPLTDFLGTVPGYFEYDISGWFLGFILVFFGIIFGDGGYGLLITAVAGGLIIKARAAKKDVPAAYLLIALMGGATILWGLLTCTWFGMAPEQLPDWLKSLSVPVISNVNADRLWYPFWTHGEAALTTAQNTQIVCFTLALIQLTVAHVMGMIKKRQSLKMLSDLGSVLQLLGMFYVVLCLVVNGEVFPLGLVIAGIPVGTIAIAFVGIGFVMSFVFANYEGSIGASILDSLKNIVSVLLGVVNVFSDIVSYIRLWAVGLAGAAISATVNELAGPMLGNLVSIAIAIMLLVFGHGLNMILNVLSVIVHGVRLNTLEFSSHLDMSWSGHQFKPFEE